MEGTERRDERGLSSGALALDLNDEGAARAASNRGAAPPEPPHVGTTLDPGSIGRLVEQEIASMLDAAQAEADRIGSEAMVVIRAVEEKIEALQQELSSAVAELKAFAARTERSASAARRSSEGPLVPETEGSVAAKAGRSVAAEPERPPAPAARPTPAPSIPAVLTEPPAAMRAVDVDDPPVLDIPSSHEVVRLLRQHLA